LSKKVAGSLTTSGNERREISHADASKGNRLKMMADYVNVPLESTVAIGDSMSDYPMYQEAAVSVVMANAGEQVNAISTYITRSNVDNGVAYAIENYILADNKT